ncbi:MAG: ACT domain-containing protein [Sedimentisphaerales bacterium]|nr:ACT domain-containing protein [Sedimentisphaerales bacterium]
MYIASQFSIFMVNKPGVLAQVLGEFARARINIVAMTMMDSAEHGVLRVVFENAESAREILKKLSMPFNETEVICITLANQSGALATVAEKLAKNHINISYAYCTAGAKGGRTTGVLKVADVKKVMHLLEKNSNKNGKKDKNSHAAIRRAGAERKR